MRSFNPATGEKVWEGRESTAEEIADKMQIGRKAFHSWSQYKLEDRIAILEKYAAELTKRQPALAELISKETGKPLWESSTEVSSMIQKVAISLQAYHERCSVKELSLGPQTLRTFFRPHGLVAVLGPFYFPGHLPNGHIVPALLAGNALIFKPSEFAPAVGESIRECFDGSGLPNGTLQIVQGGHEVGQNLIEQPALDGLFFTGSAATGLMLSEKFAKHPEKILALEMGGNNPLIVSSISDIPAAVNVTIQSAFLTSGQRCSCARRLILLENATQKIFIEALLHAVKQLRIGFYTELPEPFMGPVIHMKSAERLLTAQDKLIALGANPLLRCNLLNKNRPLLTPGILDVTALTTRPDEEYFGPLLQIISVPNFEAAIAEANQTEYGLTAGLLSTSEKEWHIFARDVRAGVINWNTPLTGASSKAPFGGLKKSGNHRPSAYFAADYCSYPVASMQTEHLKLPSTLLPGIKL
jgi:succinylglutamic semialdehyde dehydrogenase